MTTDDVDAPPRVREKKINVPMQYRNGAKFLKSYLEEGKSLSNAIDNTHCKISSMYSLLSKIRANRHILDQVIEKTEIFQKEPRLNPWMGKFLIGELLFGRGQLTGNSKPVTCVLSYEEQLRESLNHVDGEITTEKFEYKIPRYIRINTLKIKRSEVHEYLQNEGWCLVPRDPDETYEQFLEKIRKLEDDHYLIDFHVHDILVFPSSSRRVWAHNELVRDWQLILQDKASCLPPFLLNPPKGAQVLDMCAAPGMKTTYLAALMKNKGKVYAIERDVKRYKELCGTVDLADSRIVQPINEDAFNIDNERCPVEYILLDPSCSGSGMLNRDGKEQFDRERVYKLAGLQYKLLKHAMVAFPAVKRIVYSTCSRYPEENEDVVHGIVRTTANFKLVNGVDLLDNKWTSKGSELFGEIGTRCLYARTTDDMTCTFFVAVFERCAEGEFNEFYEAKRFTGANNNNQQQPTENRNERRKKKWQQSKLENGGNENGEDEPLANEDSPLNEENDVPAENRNERRKKKWQQAKLEIGGNDNGEDEQPANEENEVPTENRNERRKKKWQQAKLENDADVPPANEHSEEVLNEGNEEVPKKPKKSKKHSISHEEEAPPAEVPKKKSKKAKVEAEPCEEIPEEPVKKVKKSKKSRDETDEQVDEPEPEMAEKREKKSKKKSSEDHTEAEVVDGEDLPKKEKKSKKKKHADVEEAVEVEPEVKPKKSKKSKKVKSDC